MDIRVYTDRKVINGETYICDYYFVGVIDMYTSLIWNDKYYECGDFQLDATDGCGDLVKNLKLGDILMIADSDRAMIVEKYQTEVTPEDGAHYTITGRSIETLLNRRIVWGTVEYEDTLDQVVEAMIEANFINPVLDRRKFPHLFYEATDEPFITSVDVNVQYTAKGIYDAISELCEAYHVGMKMIFDPDEYTFTFSLFTGEDHSYNQMMNPYVIFSEEYENLKSWNYYRDSLDEANVAFVIGVARENVKGEDTTMRIELPDDNIHSGFNRKEVYIDGAGVNTNTTYIKNKHTFEKKLSEEEYKALLIAEGKEQMAEYKESLVISASADVDSIFVYGRDYQLGDVVQLEDKNVGFSYPMRITGMVMCYDKKGFEAYPLFEQLTDEEMVRLYGKTFGQPNVTIYGLEADIPLLPVDNVALIHGTQAYCVDTGNIYAFIYSKKEWVLIDTAYFKME